MFKKTALLTGIGLALSATAHADYRFEVGPRIIGGDFSGIRIDGTAYLKSVDTSKGPLAEAAFQDHASFVNLNYTDGETDVDGPVDDLESESYGINGRLVTEDGKAAVNTKLEHDSPVYKALAQKHSYMGEATIFGRKYDADYAPLVSDDGHLTGALFVGVAK